MRQLLLQQLNHQKVLNGNPSGFDDSGHDASDTLSQRHGIPLEYVNVEDALIDVLGIESAVDLLFKQLTYDSIVALLAEYDFLRLFPTVVDTFRFDESVIPEDTPQRLVEVTVRANGEVWRIHKNDVDPWPSNPHAHNLASQLTLHLGTGELFRKRRNTGKKIAKKHLIAIREGIKNCSLPPLSV